MEMKRKVTSEFHSEQTSRCIHVRIIHLSYSSKKVKLQDPFIFCKKKQLWIVFLMHSSCNIRLARLTKANKICCWSVFSTMYMFYFDIWHFSGAESRYSSTKWSTKNRFQFLWLVLYLFFMSCSIACCHGNLHSKTSHVLYLFTQVSFWFNIPTYYGGGCYLFVPRKVQNGHYRYCSSGRLLPLRCPEWLSRRFVTKPTMSSVEPRISSLWQRAITSQPKPAANNTADTALFQRNKRNGYVVGKCLHVHKLIWNGGTDRPWRRREDSRARHRPGLKRQGRRSRLEGENTHDRFEQLKHANKRRGGRERQTQAVIE
jgi:hypothetical protein